MKRTPVTLSIGTCDVIAPNRFVQLAAGPPPLSLRVAAAQKKQPKQEDEDKPQTPEELAWVIRVQKTQLTRCVSPIQTAEGELRLVDKPVPECGPGELSVEGMADQDVGMLLDTIERLRGEAEANATTFRKIPAAQGAAQP